jgi:CheY-like chemotaxis protein
VQCEFSLPDDVWPVEIDAGQFRQALNSLVINAMQSMPNGGKMEVRVEKVELMAGFLPPLPSDKAVKISIKDHGNGIPAEQLPRIFEPYFSTKKGSGLGLATAYSVIRKHEGQIKVESTVGVGTTFHIYLPASLATVVEEATPESAQKQLFVQGRLLVMDDEEDLLMVIGEMLKSFGYQVETTKDGAEAIDRYLSARIAGRPFDAVIMDLTVPNGMGGREAIARLRELDPEVKAIVSSGYSLDPVMANYRQYGFSGIIPKPYRMEELRRELEKVLKSSSSSSS